MKIVQRILILLIRGYQAVLSPALAAFFGPAGRCRYEPTCSHYALEAVRRHGAVAGSYLAAHRLCRCHPWAPHGEDPVPETFSFRLGIFKKTRRGSVKMRPVGHGL